MGGQAAGQLRHQLFAAEEELALVQTEGGQAGEGTAPVVGGGLVAHGQCMEADVDHLLAEGADGLKGRSAFLAGRVAQAFIGRHQGRSQRALLSRQLALQRRRTLRQQAGQAFQTELDLGGRQVASGRVAEQRPSA